MRRAIGIVVVAWSTTAVARDARVTAITPSTAYIDAGAADGLAAGASWQATIDNRTVAVRVVAVASHEAVLEIEGARPHVGSLIALPAGLVGVAPVELRPPPSPMPAWHDDPATLAIVQRAASGDQPVTAGSKPEPTVTGELALTAFLAADMTNSSTSTQDVGLSSQLAIESGAWRYDHLLDAHLAATPELFIAPLQHAQARFDVYLLRLAYAPAGAAYAAAIGRQPAAPLGELGTIDGGRARLTLDKHFDLTLFAGLRPASDLGLSLAPRAGTDLGWQTTTADGLQARADAGLAIDEYRGHLDRALAALSASVATRRDIAHVDAALDFADDATGRGGAQLSRLAGFARARRGKITTSVQVGYDRPFLDRALFAEAPDLVLGPRTFGALDIVYAARTGLDLGGSTRVSRGDGFTSGYADVLARWYDANRGWQLTLAPHAIAGTLVDELGIRGSLDLPLLGWTFGIGGTFDRVYAGGENAFAGIGRLTASRPFLHRWRTALSSEIAAGDGPPRLFLFGLLAYRFGH